MRNASLKIPAKNRKTSYSEDKLEISVKTDFVLNLLLGISIYIFSFFLFYFIKRDTFIIEPEYYRIFGIILISVIFGSILSSKPRINKGHSFSQIFRKNYISLILSLGFLSLWFLIFEISFASRFMLLGTFITGALIEIGYYIFISDRRKKVNFIERSKLSLNYLIIDGLILTSAIFFKIVLKFDYNSLDSRHFAALVVSYISWIFSAVITHKFNPIENANNKWHAFGMQQKFYVLNLSLIAISIYVLQISDDYLNRFLESTLIYTGISFVYFVYRFSEKITNKTDEAAISFLKTYEMRNVEKYPSHDLGNLKYQVNISTPYESNLRQVLEFEYLKDFKNIFSFLDRKIDLKSIDAKKSVILRSLDPYNIQVIPENSQEFIMNLHELNDFRKINDYLRLINSKLINGGIFAGSFIPNKKRHHRFLKKYTFFIGNTFYFFDFLWKRVFPKLPFLRNFYFKFTNGKDRALSLTEGLGRLVYNGFDILDMVEINDSVFFAIRKIKEPANYINHSYSIIFKMRRLGKNNKPIFVYKLRTMHPYAEFLQEFIYKNNKLEGGGKFKDDFRIPIWGKIFRELWIDELPMIFNWLKRDLKLVGVRPISFQYLSLYSKEHQNFRQKFKPGLVPPFYADLP